MGEQDGNVDTRDQNGSQRDAETQDQDESQREASTSEEPQEKRGFMRRIGGATGAVLVESGRQIAGQVLTGIHPLKLAGKIAAGATLGTAGLLLGVASGDPTKAFQYTTGGAIAGSKLADSLSNKEILDGEKLKEEAEMAYYGDEYKDHQIKEQKKAFQKDASNINYIRKTMGVSQADAEQILSTTGEQCFNNGITNVEDIATIHKLTQGKDSISFDQAVAARNYAKKRLPSDTDQMTETAIKRHKNQWKKEYEAAGYKNAEQLADKSFDLAIRFNKAQSGLTKSP